jgi:hypothetical protein
VISFANVPIDARLDLSAGASQVKGPFTRVDELDNARFQVPDAMAFALKLEPYKVRVLQVSAGGR